MCANHQPMEDTTNCNQPRTRTATTRWRHGDEDRDGARDFPPYIRLWQPPLFLPLQAVPAVKANKVQQCGMLSTGHGHGQGGVPSEKKKKCSETAVLQKDRV